MNSISFKHSCIAQDFIIILSKFILWNCCPPTSACYWSHRCRLPCKAY